MADYSLVPVEHQPDFENVTLVPVDHDPFSADGVAQQAPGQQARSQLAQPPPPLPATGVHRLYVGPAAKITQVPEEGESWDPGSEASDASTDRPVASTPSQDKLRPDLSHFIPLGELKPATFTPTQQIGHRAIDALTAFGVPLHNAQELATRIGNLLGLTPLGVAGSFLNLIDAKRRDDFPGAVEAASGYRVRRASVALPAMKYDGELTFASRTKKVSSLKRPMVIGGTTSTTSIQRMERPRLS
ncbi:hypothetical protein CIT40_33810 [Bradyrhizobium amphicarpaeae]|nr:hypothetical protein [Bradyrhizobium amphicarpaeae]